MGLKGAATRLKLAGAAVRSAAVRDKYLINHAELDRRLPLAERRVLEIGCFKRLPTVALAQGAHRVMAFDGRIENVANSIVRCNPLDHRALNRNRLCGSDLRRDDLVAAPVDFRCDVEGAPPGCIAIDGEVLHHVGVLYL